jgi:hypothetical protein
LRLLARGLEIVTMLNKFRAEGEYRSILVSGVSCWHDDRNGNAIAPARECQALAVIATRGRNETCYTRALATAALRIRQPTSHLERASRRMVFMLDPYFRSNALRQQWPRILRRRRHRLGDDGAGVI